MIRRCFAYMGVIALASTATVIGVPGIASADEVRDDQWYLDELGVNDAHELSQGEGVTIGMIDSGVDASHPDLEDNIVEGQGYGDGHSDGLKDSGPHGTSVASILAGHGHGSGNTGGVLGIAPKAEIIPIAMHCDDGKCAGNDPRDWWDEAFEYLMEQDVDIISVSVDYSNDGSDVVTQAAEQGIPVVGSAGNSTRDWGADLGEQEESRVSWPARATNAIPVTGVDEKGKFWKESRDLGRAAQHPQFGLSAPATDLPGAMPGGDYATNSGTSGAAPIVSGTLALIKSAYPDLTYDQWLDRLLDTVDENGDEGFDDKYGWGTVNPLDALTEETTYEDSSGEHVSSPDDRLPLEEQGKDTDGGSGDEGNDEDAAADGNPIAAVTSGVPAWLIIAIITGLLVVTAAIITTVVLTQRRKKRRVGPPPSDGTPGPGGPPPGPGGPPPGPGSPPPGPPSGPPQSDPGNLTAAPPSGAGNPPPDSTPPGPPPPGPDGAGAPTSAPPATQHNPQTPPGPNAPFTPPQ